MKWLVIGVLLLPSFALGEIYRWVDTKGQVHFADKAPSSEQVEVISGPEPEKAEGGSAPTSSELLQRQQKISNILAEERKAKEAQRRAEEEKALKRARYCERFKNRLAYLDRAGLIYDENEDGTRTYLSDEKGDRYREEVKQRYQAECGH